jgi:hypothetical protein
LAGEGGAILGLGASDFEFGVDPSADPELALVNIVICVATYCNIALTIWLFLFY